MTGTWTQELVAGKKVDVFQPSGVDRPRFALLFLHGVGLETLRNNDVYTRLFDQLQLLCVSPHGQRSWWADRLCAEFDPAMTAERFLLDHVLPFIHERWKLPPRS